MSAERGYLGDGRIHGDRTNTENQSDATIPQPAPARDVAPKPEQPVIQQPGKPVTHTALDQPGGEFNEDSTIPD